MSDLADRLTAALADRYVVERELGRGGMATVFLAQDRKHDRPVALKVLHPELAASLGPERFLREIQIAARLQHPHILGLIDSGKANGYLYYVMPFVKGESLRQKLAREGEMPVSDATRILRELVDALAYAHEQGVIHRDVKPENVLLSGRHAFVADFGVAKAISAASETPELTSAGLALGTPAYMAPEQSIADPSVDHRVDIYAVGVVAYEMLAGRPPFAERTPQALVAAHATQVPVSLGLRRPAIPASLEALVMRCLEKHPADRPQTAAELLRALDELPTISTPAPSGSVSPAVPSGRRRIAMMSAALLVTAALGLLLYPRLTGPGAGIASRDAVPGVEAEQSVAVLPFINLSSAKENEYFADGMTEELSSVLAQIPQLRVAARTSAFEFKGREVDVREIGRRLGVASLVEGSVRRAGDRLRVTAQLVSASDGYHLWSETYERPLNDVFAVQEEIARAIAGALQVRFSEKTRPSSAGYVADLKAYDLYLRGRYAWRNRTAEGLTQARDFFEQAIAKDPRFARAYAGLADAYVVTPLWSDVAPSQAYPRARAAALQALRLDSTLPEPHAALADVHALYEWDWPAAERGFRRSLELDPNNANTHHWYSGDYLILVGRMEEAVREERRARDLDPLSPTFNAALGITLYRDRRLTEALTQIEGTLSLDRDFTFAQLALCEVRIALGKYIDAIQACERAVDPKVRNSGDLVFLGYAYAKAGRRRDAERLLRELLERADRGYVGPASVAVLLTGLGDTVQAFRWLERAVEAHDPFLLYHLAGDPILEGLRKDPRGVAIMRRVGLNSRAQ